MKFKRPAKIFFQCVHDKGHILILAAERRQDEGNPINGDLENKGTMADCPECVIAATPNEGRSKAAF